MKLDKVLVMDIECYVNYTLVMFKKITSGEVIYFESLNDSEMNVANILHILNNYTIVTFNGIKYDMTIVEALVAGFNNASTHNVSNMLIQDNMQPWQVRKQVGIAAIYVDHIDLIEVAPLKANLKIYGGRLHCKKMQDLPIHHEATILEEDLLLMREYCENDLDTTKELFEALSSEIQLRELMSEEYDVDLRSKSDAQVAEAVIKKELKSKYSVDAKRPKISEGERYYFKPPSNLSFKTEQLQDLLYTYKSRPFTVGKSGHVEFTFDDGGYDEIKGKEIKPASKFQFTIGDTKYTVGTGGIHSCEKKARHTNEHHILRDYDVASFYPAIILNNKLTPKHLGKPFLEIYQSIVNRRLKAKKEGRKAINESLKITINGSFGKLGSKWSCLYSPDLMMQVTVTGQLTLLMLIEELELNGISVVSANTDGIVVKMKPDQEVLAESIVEDWMFDTDYVMESTDYISLNSRDINNYIAVKDGSVKGKGAYTDQSDSFYKLRSNPSYQICSEAVKEFLLSGKQVEETIYECKDITKFVTIRTVNGGAIKDGVLLGKAIRWYYGRLELDAIYYSTNGNKVPKSDGAVPLMELPDTFPKDIDYSWYVKEARSILKDLGYDKSICK